MLGSMTHGSSQRLLPYAGEFCRKSTLNTVRCNAGRRASALRPAEIGVEIWRFGSMMPCRHRDVVDPVEGKGTQHRVGLSGLELKQVASHR